MSRSRTLCPASISLLGAGLAWACTDFEDAIVTAVNLYAQLPSCAQKSLLLYSYFQSLALTFFRPLLTQGSLKKDTVYVFHLGLSILKSHFLPLEQLVVFANTFFKVKSLGILFSFDITISHWSWFNIMLAE